MGQLAISSIFLKNEFTPSDSGKITITLKRICNSVKETRKGRHWEVSYGTDEYSSFTIHVYKIQDRLWDFEDDMNALGITMLEFPEAIIITSAIGRLIDKENCQMISERISADFDCLRVDAELIS